MPTVGTGKNAKHFPYTAAGRAAAKKEAAKTGKNVEEKKMPGYAHGGKMEYGKGKMMPKKGMSYGKKK